MAAKIHAVLVPRTAAAAEMNSIETTAASLKYAVITPVRDEAEHIESLIESVAGQTIGPCEWVIVDDGSTDGTGAILDRASAQFPWLHVVHRANRGFRKSGGGVVQAFYDGYNSLRSTDWDFVVKLDGDLSFAPDYFQRCLKHFLEDPALGIGGGEIYHNVSGEMKREGNPRFHVRGATKIYRKACWEAIGGLWTAAGWDTIDEVKANMLGWRTQSFPELRLHHHRVTGVAEGIVRDRVKHGEVCYVSGYHPLFVLASCLIRLLQKPYVIGSAAILYGFLRAHWTHPPRLEDRAYRRYIRAQQLRRLVGMETIWR
jgi:glycosyltransferase involved in cell wall biosynthesis